MWTQPAAPGVGCGQIPASWAVMAGASLHGQVAPCGSLWALAGSCAAGVFLWLASPGAGLCGGTDQSWWLCLRAVGKVCLFLAQLKLVFKSHEIPFNVLHHSEVVSV